jgi:ribonuclease HI
VAGQHGSIKEIGGGAAATTNNRMELNAAIQGLRVADAATKIVIITDSQYMRKGITEWIINWKRHGWQTAAKKPVLNKDLWVELDELNSDLVSWAYTKGHAGDPGNERCDEIAQAFSQGLEPPMTDTTT